MQYYTKTLYEHLIMFTWQYIFVQQNSKVSDTLTINYTL